MPLPSWRSSLPEITRRLAAPPRLLVALDFDGTLAPIVSPPQDAALLPGMAPVLERLAAAPGVHLAFVSGRPLADLRQRLPACRGAVFICSHGMEISGHGLDGLPAGLPARTARFARLAEELRRSTRFLDGVLIEEKPFGIALHTRAASAPVAAAARALLDRIAARENSPAAPGPPLRIQEGHCVAELVPGIAITKGTALTLLLDRLGIPGSAVLCAGDDQTDESMFLALPNALSLRIGDAPTAAACRAAGPAEMLDLLQRLADLRTAPRPPA